MKIILIIFLLVIFSSNLALANNKDKITLEDIETILFKDTKKFTGGSRSNLPEDTDEEKKYKKMMKESHKGEQRKKRRKTRGPATCMYSWYDTDGHDPDEIKRCYARALMAILTYSEKSKKRRPGDIFLLYMHLEP